MIRVAGLDFEDPPALFRWVVAEASLGRQPARPVLAAPLDDTFRVGLTAAMLQHDDPATVAEGARLAHALGDPRLVALCDLALATHDTAVLLTPDPGNPGRSVEDALLASVAFAGTHEQPAGRAACLTRLRHAGLRDEELHVLLTWGTPDDVLTWLPALCEEGIPHEALARAPPALQGAIHDVIDR